MTPLSAPKAENITSAETTPPPTGRPASNVSAATARGSDHALDRQHRQIDGVQADVTGVTIMVPITSARGMVPFRIMVSSAV